MSSSNTILVLIDNRYLLQQDHNSLVHRQSTWQEGLFSFPTNQAIFFFLPFMDYMYRGHPRGRVSVRRGTIHHTHHSPFFMSQPPIIANGDTTHVGLAKKSKNYPCTTWRMFVGGLQCFESLEQSSEVVPYLVCVFFPFILDIKFVGGTSRGHTGGRSHRISHPPSFCGACLNFSREKDSAIPFPRRP